MTVFLFLAGLLFAEDDNVLEISAMRKIGDKVSLTLRTVYLGFSKDQVRNILGEPDEENLGGRVWYYRDGNMHIRFGAANEVIGWQEDIEVKCPVCRGYMKLMPVVYGPLTPDLIELTEKNEALSGGRYWTKISPLWGLRCLTCRKDFSVKDPGIRLHIEIDKSLDYRPPKNPAEDVIKEKKNFDDQLKIRREKEPW